MLLAAWELKAEFMSAANFNLIKEVLIGLPCSVEHILFSTFVSKLLHILCCHKTGIHKQMHLPFFFFPSCQNTLIVLKENLGRFPPLAEKIQRGRKKRRKGFLKGRDCKSINTAFRKETGNQNGGLPWLWFV